MASLPQKLTRQFDIPIVTNVGTCRLAASSLAFAAISGLGTVVALSQVLQAPGAAPIFIPLNLACVAAIRAECHTESQPQCSYACPVQATSSLVLAESNVYCSLSKVSADGRGLRPWSRLQPPSRAELPASDAPAFQKFRGTPDMHCQGVLFRNA
jgi:hypothetical protein